MYVLFFTFLDIYLLQDITICPVEGGGGLKSIFLEQWRLNMNNLAQTSKVIVVMCPVG